MFKRYMIVLLISAGVSGLIFWFNSYWIDQLRAFLDQQREGGDKFAFEEVLRAMGEYQQAQDMFLYITAGILVLILVSAVLRWIWSGTKAADNW